MSVVHKCDICGAIYEQYHPIDKGADISLSVYVIEHHLETPYRTQETIECCPDCTSKILGFIDILKIYPDRWRIDIPNEY